MKTLKYGLAVALLGSASHAFAQYNVDALRFSQSQPTGTARTLGLGGATTAVGGDYGSVAVNPAGLGMFQRSEFSFSPGLSSINTDGRAFGTTTADSRSNLNVASLGLVFTNRRPDDNPNPWRAGSFAIGLTRVADYNQSLRYKGRPGLNQDIFQRLSEDQGAELDDLAYDTYLTDDTGPGTRRFISDPFNDTGELDQAETVRTTGAQTQFDLAYGASYQDKLYIGGGVGIVGSRYTSESILTASDAQPVNNNPGTSFASLTLRNTLETKGTGINARVGIIYKPVDAVRIGASVQTPTYYQFTESYTSALNATFDKPIKVDGQTYTSASSSLDVPFSYALASPFRATGGLAVVVGKYGFLSGDVEFVDYSNARLSNYNDQRNFGPENDAIKDLYGSTVNLRAGAEARLDAFRVRAGYAHYGNPYQNSATDQSRTYYTGGVGMRQKNFFLDLAGVYSTGTRLYSPYYLSSAANTPVVTADSKRFTATITTGFMF